MIAISDSRVRKFLLRMIQATYAAQAPNMDGSPAGEKVPALPAPGWPTTNSTPTTDRAIPTATNHEMRVWKKMASAATVTTGMTAMISEARDAEVSLIPRESKRNRSSRRTARWPAAEDILATQACSRIEPSEEKVEDDRGRDEPDGNYGHGRDTRIEDGLGGHEREAPEEHRPPDGEQGGSAGRCVDAGLCAHGIVPRHQNAPRLNNRGGACMCEQALALIDAAALTSLIS